MQTAVGVFGSERGNNPAITNLNSPPFIAVEHCRELSGVKLHEKRRNVSEYLSLFPTIDFSLIESDEDILWKPDIRETKDKILARGLKFLNWLWTRKEKEIAIVTHSIFLFETMKAFGADCHPYVMSEICSKFENCELRSLVIVDKSTLLGSQYFSTTNYPGKTPQGLHLPSVGDEKYPDKVKDVSSETRAEYHVSSRNSIGQKWTLLLSYADA
ncbi:Histidine phosphatase superfamily [Parasponia andersonii]|uniref:Histidine phosphatase superfamily n=1 Tax=Parasponia andersonii TaxID=3476 RepID=A0A2P5CF21_PARAD|nr:Histidine phosphatase superfamily [Parasponia andersonii]